HYFERGVRGLHTIRPHLIGGQETALSPRHPAPPRLISQPSPRPVSRGFSLRNPEKLSGTSGTTAVLYRLGAAPWTGKAPLGSRAGRSKGRFAILAKGGPPLDRIR